MYISYSYIHNLRSGCLNHRPIVVPKVARLRGKKKNYDTPSVSVKEVSKCNFALFVPLFLHYCMYANN